MNDDTQLSTSHGLAHKIKRLFYKKNSKEDLKDFLQEAKENNVIDNEEAFMLAGVLAFSEQKVRDVMIPKSQITCISHDCSFDDAIALMVESGHSRFPVEKDEKIIGILLAKDLLGYINDKNNNSFLITCVMRPVRFIPESKPLDILLREFRHQRAHMAIVTNEYGETAGLITVEDVLELIVGDIDDEHDEDAEINIKKLDNDSFLINALTEIDEFNKHFATDLSDETADTIGGHILIHLGYVPKTGEKIDYSGYSFIIKEADDRRIISLILTSIAHNTNELKTS